MFQNVKSLISLIRHSISKFQEFRGLTYICTTKKLCTFVLKLKLTLTADGLTFSNQLYSFAKLYYWRIFNEKYGKSEISCKPCFDCFYVIKK